jgi:orotate phosphoribosyltransferase
VAIEAEEIFRATGTMLEGHFLLSSGLHSSVYWEKFRVLQHPQHTEPLCQLIAAHFQDQAVQLVAGPTTGGILLAYEVARQLGVRSIYAEKEGGARVFRRGFNISPGERTLVVDDVLTTGGSVREVVDQVRGKGGEVIGVAVLVDRSQGGVDFGVPLFGCYKTSAPNYKPEECPLCRAKVPLKEPGRGGS